MTVVTRMLMINAAGHLPGPQRDGEQQAEPEHELRRGRREHERRPDRVLADVPPV